MCNNNNNTKSDDLFLLDRLQYLISYIAMLTSLLFLYFLFLGWYEMRIVVYIT